MFYEKPVFFEANRVFRVYTGGKLLGKFVGKDYVDDFYPEEWVASSVTALNEGSTDPFEGVSKIEGTDIYLSEAYNTYKKELLGDKESLGILVKYLDSAIRLPVQAHPDREFSKKYLNSTYGKEECWYILDTREGASISFGFKDGVTKEEFVEAIDKSETDKTAMEKLIKNFPVKKGDVVFIPANTVHAICAGCLILEVQEPSDFTIQPERWCGDYRLSDNVMYLGLEPEIALKCFKFEESENPFIEPIVIENSNGVLTEQLIGENQTNNFSLRRFKFNDGRLSLDKNAIYIVADGEGKVLGDGYERALKKGDYFLMPACAKGKFEVESENLELLACY